MPDHHTAITRFCTEFLCTFWELAEQPLYTVSYCVDSNLNEMLFSTLPLFCYIENIYIYGEGYFSLWLQVDNITAYVRHCLTNKNLLDKVNVVLLSDHGMATVTPQNIYNLTQYVNKAFFEIADSSPVLQIYPAKGIPLSVCCSNLYNIISARTFPGTFVFENTHIPWILILLIYGIVQRVPATMSLSTAPVSEALSYRKSTPARNLAPFWHIHIITRSAS